MEGVKEDKPPQNVEIKLQTFTCDVQVPADHRSAHTAGSDRADQTDMAHQATGGSGAVEEYSQPDCLQGQ